MEPGRPTDNIRRRSPGSIVSGDENPAAQQRLAALLEANAQVTRDRSLFRNDRERVEAAIMRNPIDSKKAFAYFGYMIGTMPPAAIAIKVMSEGPVDEPLHALFLMLLLTAGVVTGMVGYVTGKYIPGAVGYVRDVALPNRIALLSLTGFCWGALSGMAGGIFLFVIGAVFAGIAGGIVGALTVPIMAMLHEALRRGDVIEMKHFLPVAFGITLSLCAFILGL